MSIPAAHRRQVTKGLMDIPIGYLADTLQRLYRKAKLAPAVPRPRVDGEVPSISSKIRMRQRARGSQGSGRY